MVANIKKSNIWTAKANLIYFCTSHHMRRIARKHEERLLHHCNVEAIQLLDISELQSRLKRTKPFELVS